MAALFTALRPSQEIQEALVSVGKDLIHGGICLPFSDFHITLVYFGNVPMEQITPLLKVPFRPVSGDIVGLDIFSHGEEDVVVLRLEASESLIKFQRVQAEYAEKLGISVRKPYIPHITLARGKKLTEPEKAKIWPYKNLPLGSLSFDTWHIMGSVRPRHDPQGRYDVLATQRLSA